MARYVKSGTVNTVQEINSELEKIATAQDEFLTRNGEAPNEMKSGIDMNGNRITNLPSPANLSEPLRLSDLNSLSGTTINLDSEIKVYTSVAELAAQTDLEIGQAVRTKGYYSTSDGGGAEYVVVASGTGTDDGGSYLDLVANQAQLNTSGSTNIKQFGAKGDGVTDDYNAIRSALNFNNSIYIPQGTYLVNTKLVLTSNCKVVGEHRNLSVIVSGVIGDSLFGITGSSVNNILISDLSLEGNGLSGASGNGHAIGFIDPLLDSGTHNPQNCVIERLFIRDFLGNSPFNNTANTIPAHGIIQNDGLQNVYREIAINNCGGGFYMRLCQNTTITDSVVSFCVNPAIYAVRCEALRVLYCDLISSGELTLPANYEDSSTAGGVIVSQFNEGLTVKGCKLKNTSGKAQIISRVSDGDVFDSNWISSSMLLDVPHKSIYAERSPAIKIINNTFSPVTTIFSTQKYEQVELYTNQSTEAFSAIIENNTFLDVSGFDIDYNIKIGGASITSKFSSVSISGNRFGSRGARSAPSVVTNDIIINNCAFLDGVIEKNNSYAATNVTRVACISQSGANTANASLSQNSFSVNGGVITDGYTSLSATKISGVGTPEGVVTANVGAVYTRTDGGASTTLYIKESGSSNTGWVAK